MQLLTVIITTHNRCQALDRLLESLLRQRAGEGFDFEVLLVNNNSHDQTDQVVKKFLPMFRGRLRYLFEKRKGKTYAVNKAIHQARGEVLVFTDDDTVADSGWLAHIADCFHRYSCDGVGGRVLPVYPNKTPDWIKTHADILNGPIVRYDYGQDIKPYSLSMYEFLGANFAFKRSLFMKFGVFSSGIGPGMGIMGEDTEIVKRFMKMGSRLYYCGRAVIWHPVEIQRMNLKYIGQWYWALGRFRTIEDEKDKKVDTSIRHWFGVPRYLYRQIIWYIFSLGFNVFNKRKFLLSWVTLWCALGQACELKKIYVHQHHHSYL